MSCFPSELDLELAEIDREIKEQRKLYKQIKKDFGKKSVEAAEEYEILQELIQLREYKELHG